MSNSISYDQKIGEPKKGPTMLALIKPVIQVNQILGVCPHDISGEILVFRWTSIKFFKTLFTLVILLAYFIFTVVIFMQSLINGANMVKLGIISSRVTGTLIPIAVLCLTLMKRDQFTEFFLKVQEFKAQLKGIQNCVFVIRSARRFYAFYMFLALVSCFLTATDSLSNPKSPVYFVQFFPEPTPLIRALDCLFQFYITLVTHSACAVVEVLCATISGSNVNKINKIMFEMNDGISVGGCYTTKDPIAGGQDEDLTTVTSSNDLPTYTAALVRPFKDNFEIEKAMAKIPPPGASIKPVLKAIRKFHCIAQTQALINCIFGPILALNIAWLVIEVCLLFFMEIRQLNSAYPAENSGVQGIIMIMGHNFVFTIRLLIVLVSLGNLQETSKYFDDVITSAMIKVKKSQIQAHDSNLIMIHLMRSQSNPVAFSAGGFFIFSRTTLLYVFSIVTTYVVFLLQAEKIDFDVSTNSTVPRLS